MKDYRLITAEQARGARKLLGWAKRYVATRCSVSQIVIWQAENGGCSEVMSARLRAAYEAGGVEFTDGRPGVKLKATGK